MGFTAKDGKAFGNRQQMKAYEERGGEKKEKPAQQMAEHAEPDGEEASEMPIEEMVAQHGPAEKVEIAHAEGRHTKTSHHGGQKHISHHDSAHEAHQHGMKAAGLEQEEQPEREMAGAMPAGDGAIPGM